MPISTADLCDEHPDDVSVGEPILLTYGGVAEFSGPISTVRVREDNVLVRAALEESGEGGVLVVDGGGSLRCALLGDRLAELARANGWSGIVGTAASATPRRFGPSRSGSGRSRPTRARAPSAVTASVTSR